MTDANGDVLRVLPHRADALARLGMLLRNGEPVVTVVGKYNHGKSRLLNELVGSEVFAVADRRETVRLADTLHEGVLWLDAPGLDADVASGDDRQALHAAWLHADVRLFVHAAKEGELDAAELTLLGQLLADAAQTQRQTIFVLSQIDQLPGDDELDQVVGNIARQVPGLTIQRISSTRFRKGQQDGKRLLIEQSDMPSLLRRIQEAVAATPAARVHETSLLLGELTDEVAALLHETDAALGRDRERQHRQRQAFDLGLSKVIGKVSRDIESMLASLGQDHAVIPDKAKDAYRLTAGKVERARIQVAYSRACIEIDAFLAGQGVVTIPTDQETVARALNTVVVAVMGVSVKFRDDLRKIFSSLTGRERLQREFARYYELSRDRKALAARIDAAAASLAALTRAMDALRRLERNG
ncbi:GTPase [Chitinasiproducens palmae]|uniref:50S ribosome-binding GTPase n=1 Tax=Chitinasiproducens palmae TaxID=1770053 RepID=A0A1H2PKQ1_9BURK|nr:GTPase [Chitinasiproducens palmae]SDV47026.1 50S ribosome-binding GTPase [Chitinasiproducens palmae]